MARSVSLFAIAVFDGFQKEEQERLYQRYLDLRPTPPPAAPVPVLSEIIIAPVEEDSEILEPDAFVSVAVQTDPPPSRWEGHENVCLKCASGMAREFVSVGSQATMEDIQTDMEQQPVEIVDVQAEHSCDLQ